MRLYLNLRCGDYMRDHGLILDIERDRLARLVGLAEQCQLARVSIRPDYELICYRALAELPTDIFVGHDAAEAFADQDPEDLDPGSEPESRFSGALLNVRRDGSCFVEGHEKHSGDYRVTETFSLEELDAFIAGQVGTRTIHVTLRGRDIVSWSCEFPTPDLRITTIDLDVDGIERDRLYVVRPQDQTPAPAFVCASQRIEIADAPAIDDASAPQFDFLFEEG
jgi:hypothetical protein